MLYLITRHKATLEWLEKQLDQTSAYVHTPHLAGLHTLKAGDHVIGNLPIDKIARLTSQGVRYTHIILNVPFNMRGKEYEAGDLEIFGAYLQAFQVNAISASDCKVLG
ncbi:MAG: CRISPR-associated protein Csx16 [Pseudomonadales bacterium]|nr:CRISPR-associated protein Csx16 [Pseudomonadales bacterium]